jgi:signal transduction histidine kinase
MVAPSRSKSIAFFTALGILVLVATVTLNVGWIVLNWRQGLLMVVGLIFFLIISAGVVLNTIFLVREIRRNEQHDAFLNAVTHELKTPVASIRLYLETLKKRPLDEAKRQEFYQIMLEDSDRLMGTIEQVLRAARAGNSRKPQFSVRLDLGALVEEVLALARSRHHLPAEALQYANTFGAGERPLVAGDAEELKAAVSNLVDNAIKYSGQQVRVLVKLERTGDRHVAVRVRDQGLGIPPAELKRIFKRFYRIPGGVAARIKGTGIGLFIVNSVAKRHGGRAWAESTGTGRGSTFTLQLPIAT